MPEQVAKEPAQRQQRGQPERGADRVEEQKTAERHAILARDGRSQCGQAGHKFGNHKGDFAAAAKGVLCTPDTDGWLHGELAQDSQHVMAVLAANEIPGAVCRQRGPKPDKQRQGKADFAGGGQSPRSQQDRRSGQRNSELLHQNPGEEQQVSVHQQEMCRQFHWSGSCLRVKVKLDLLFSSSRQGTAGDSGRSHPMG